MTPRAESGVPSTTTRPSSTSSTTRAASGTSQGTSPITQPSQPSTSGRRGVNTAKHVDNALSTANTKKTTVTTYLKYWVMSIGSFSVTTFLPSKRDT